MPWGWLGAPVGPYHEPAMVEKHNPKQVAGYRAAEMVQTGSVVGLGTGSTVFFVLIRLAERIREEGLEITAVPTSVDTETKAREMGIPLVSLDEVGSIDLCIDGADEIDGDFHMIKGGGGALLREKVVASISEREVIVVGPEKVVSCLGTTFRLPVEVVPFARSLVVRKIQLMGAEPIVRMSDNGGSFLTDNGNEILDCHFPEGIDDPAALELALDAIPGVVESGLFISLAHAVVIGHPDGRSQVLEKD